MNLLLWICKTPKQKSKIMHNWYYQLFLINKSNTFGNSVTGYIYNKMQ